MSDSALSYSQRGQRWHVAIYVTAAFLFWTSLYLYVPTLPVYVRTLTDNLALVGVVLAMYGLWQAIIRLPLGITADWLGWRKPFILGGFLLAGIGSWLMGTAESTTGLIVGRAITGLAAGTWVPLLVVFSTLFPAQEAVRATAMLTLVSSVSRMLATGINGTLNELGGYSLAFNASVGAALLAVVVILPVSEKARVRRPPRGGQIGRLIMRRDVLLPAGLNAVAQYGSWAATFGFFPILARDLGAGDTTLSLLLSMNVGLVLLGNLVTTGFVNRIGSRRLVGAGFFLQAVGMGMAAFSGSLWHIFVAQICMGLASGTGYPVMMGMSIEHVDESERTTAMGLHQAVYAIGMFAGPWLSGILADEMGLQPMFGVTSVVILLAGVMGARMLAGKRAEDSVPGPL